jgi:hypothetical protein
MKPAARERLAILLMPSLVIALGWWGWLRPSNDSKDAAAALAAAQTASPSDAALTAERKHVAELTAQQMQLTNDRKIALDRWQAIREQRDDRRSAATTAQIAELFRRHNLPLIAEARMSTDQTGALVEPLTKALDRINRKPEDLIPELKKLNRKPAAGAITATPAPILSVEEMQMAPAARAPRTFWKIEFAGRFSDVQAALAELAQNETTAIPIQLTMAKAPANLSLRRWSLVVCL